MRGICASEEIKLVEEGSAAGTKFFDQSIILGGVF
jgi:hypothetical protein